MNDGARRDRSNLDEWIAALELPPETRVDKIVSKKLLAEHCAKSARDRKAIHDEIEHASWVAVLKPATIGVPAYRGTLSEVPEIAVLRIDLRDGAQVERHAERIHRGIPYPVLLLVASDVGAHLSLEWSSAVIDAHVNHGDEIESGPTVDRARVMLPDGRESELCDRFRAAMAMGRLPRRDLLALYGGWLDACTALLVARRSGEFELAGDLERSRRRRVALATCLKLESEIAKLRASAEREVQLARRVELNLERKRLEAVLVAATGQLRSGVTS